jgi:hypothetical protein
VQANNWETLDEISNGIYEGKFDFTLSQPLIKQIFHALSWVIEPLYRKTMSENAKTQSTKATSNLRPSESWLKSVKPKELIYTESTSTSSIAQADSVDSLLQQLARILKVITVYIGFDQVLLQKILRLFARVKTEETKF